MGDMMLVKVVVPFRFFHSGHAAGGSTGEDAIGLERCGQPPLEFRLHALARKAGAAAASGGMVRTRGSIREDAMDLPEMKRGFVAKELISFYQGTDL